jgi:hypothetical protein
MGTRGLYGFYKDGVDKLTYNHFDSYPSGLGKDVINFIRKNSIENMNQIFDRIIMVDGDSTPTKEQQQNCILYYSNCVSTGKPTEWYSLLRNAQGDLDAFNKGLLYMIDNKDFIKESLFCEWAYIINLTDNVLEIYKGFQKEQQNNRYVSDKDEDGYYNCKLIESIPFSTLVCIFDEDVDNYVERIEKSCDEEEDE